MKKYIFLSIVLYAGTASAYLDPGTGGLLLQLLLGGVAGAAMVLKLYWQRITAAWNRMFKKTPEVQEEMANPELKPAEKKSN